MVQLFAHRGASGPHPEMTRAAFAAAVEAARTHDRALGLECDVHFTADGELGCLHDLTVQRTGRGRDGGVVDRALADLTVAELRELDFGSWRDDLTAGRELAPAEREFMTLPDLLDLVAAAREDGVRVGLAIETKHPVPRDDEVEAAVAALLSARGWTGPDDGVRLITFDPAGIARAARLLPGLPLTYLIGRVESWQAVADGRLDLPAGTAIGPGGHLLRADPALVGRIHDAGHECHVWTVNEPTDIAAVLGLGVDAVTSDHPDRLVAALS